MDAGEFITSFLADFLVTVIAYGLGPILLLEFHKGPISPKKLKWFHIIYTIIVSFTFNIIMSLLGLRQVGSFTPAIIWGTVFYRINKKNFDQRAKAIPSDTYTQQEAQMKQFFVDDATGEVISEPPAEEPKPVVLSYAPDFKLSGPPQPVVEPAPQDPPAPPSAPKKNSALYGVLIAICIASLAGNMVQGYLSVHKAQAHKDELAELQEEVRKQKGLVTGLKEACSDFRKNVQSLESKNREYRSYYDEHVFLNSNIGMIVNGSRYYHKYNCPIFEDADEYWAHNIEYCKYLGYSECPVCYNDDDVKFNITPKKLPPHLFYID